MSEIDRIRERVRQNRIGVRPSDKTSPEKSGGGVAPSGAQHLPGDRVFDRVTGQEGEVIGGTRENIIVPAAK